MPKFKYKTSKGTFIIDSNRPLNPQELENATSQQTESKPFQFGGGGQPRPGVGGALPEVSRLQKIGKGFQRGLPTAGQVAGGFLGGAAAAPLGPRGIAAGAATGGTLGRGIGRLEQVAGERLEREFPGRRFVGEAVAGPIGRGVAEFSILNPEEKQRLGKEVLKTGAIEAIAAPIGLGLGRFVSKLGRGVTKELLGPRVAERGFQKGFKQMLNPEFYKGRVPKLVAQKMNNFFKRLTSVTGKATEKTIKANNITHNVADIKNSIRTLLPASGNPADLLEITASKAQKNLINEVTDEILKLKGDTRTTVSLWNLRKKIDTAIFDKRWTDDALSYLYKLRNTLNQPIKSASGDIAESFGRYSFVKEAERDLGRNFQAITGPNKEIYARKTESFIGNVLSTKKDETLRLLGDLDDLLGVDDKIIENLLDVAASETLEEKFGLGLFQRMLVGLLGGKKRIAEIGAAIQKPVVQFGKKAFGRFIPTAISESVEQPQ